MERRLTTILVADVIGWSRLTAADEENVIERYRAAYSEVVEPSVSSGGGRIVKTMGDGFLAEFPSAVAAVRAALSIQRTMVERGADDPEDRRLRLRIGVTVGDVVIDGDDILGNGVNVAARLEALSEADGIAASGMLIEALPPDLRAEFRNDGVHELKNIPGPVTVWRWRPAGSADPEWAAPGGGAEPPAIAVLPFSAGQDEEQRYFAEGLADDIGSGLARMRRMPVISAELSLAAARDGAAARDIARALGARYLVRGSVRRAGRRVRISVELLDGHSGRQIWSERYDGTLEDVFELQDEITLNVVTALEPEVVDVEIGRLRGKRPEQLGAWEHFLKGMAHLKSHREADLAAARTEFEQALAIDPDYGEAWAGLGWSHLKSFGARSGPDPQASLEAGFEAARKGVALDDRSPLTHYVMSTAYVWRDEPKLSMAELEHVLALNPYFARALMAYGNRLELAADDRADEAIDELKRALKLSPRDPDRFWYFAAISRALLVRGERHEALDWIERAISARPETAHLLYRRALCHAHLDDVAAARRDLEACAAMQPGLIESRRSWRPYGDDARNARLFEGFRRHGLAGFG